MKAAPLGTALECSGYGHLQNLISTRQPEMHRDLLIRTFSPQHACRFHVHEGSNQTTGPAMSSPLCSTGSRPRARGLGAFQHPSGLEWPSIARTRPAAAIRCASLDSSGPLRTDGMDGSHSSSASSQKKSARLLRFRCFRFLPRTTVGACWADGTHLGIPTSKTGP